MTADHTCTRHAPGVYACYSRHACRCDPCKLAARRYNKAADLRRSRGHSHYTPSGPVRAHVEALLAGGMARAEVARLAAIETVSITRLLRGDSTQLRRDRAARLLAVQPPPVTRQENGRVPSCGTVRRLDALNLNGWAGAHVADVAGLHHHAITYARTHATNHATTRARVAAAYDTLWNVHAPRDSASARTRAMAVRRGALPALAWDDGTGPHGIDNPDATPLSWRPVAPPGRGRPGFDLDDLAFLADCGLTVTQAADRLGVTKSTVEHRCERADRRDLLARLQHNKEAS